MENFRFTFTCFNLVKQSCESDGSHGGPSFSEIEI
ncbi:unnamed protein product [Linum tenue]|uniref:Uncharacterized protein n=1 Tax=Linum tenue TaxID=586396 RepID=A0AAV0IW26_9ROSI|nr:unnamed protein product [Linum tenue]